MDTTRLILTGGFLGSGKTTLLWEAASQIIKTGKKVGLITNDQAPELVDTAILTNKKMNVVEVSGSCFCCNFNGLISAIREIKKTTDADIIIAEPVGSCTDLSATIIQPIKSKLKTELVLSPLSVLADPILLSDILKEETGGLHPSAAYIFRKQLEEADIILISKSDLLKVYQLEKLKKQARQTFPNTEIMTISTKSGNGIDTWLAEVLNRTDSGKQLPEVDYNIYAEGEAVLGWLNATLEISGETVDWNKFAVKLLEILSKNCEKLNAPVGHVKLILETENNYLTGNFTNTKVPPTILGSCEKSDQARLIINARVEMLPEKLETLVRKVLKDLIPVQNKTIEKAWRCLSPGRPQSTYRFDEIVFLP